MNKHANKKLRLPLETVRTLSDQSLAQVGGALQDTKTNTKPPSNSWGPTWCGNDSCWCILSDDCKW